jgi:MAF protein
MGTPKLLLASSSIYRRQLLQKLGIDFSWESPNIDESARENESPVQLVLRLAEQKARALSSQYPNHLVIGSDQVATIDNRALGKPYNHDAAVLQLQGFSGREVTFITGLCLYNTATGKCQLKADHFKVKFRNLNTGQIENYLRREQPYDCSGSFKSEGLGICLFEKMEGKDPNSLIGLPLIELTGMLMNEGIDPLLNPNQKPVP